MAASINYLQVQEALRKHDAESFTKSKLDRVFLQRLGMLFMIGMRSRWAPRILFFLLVTGNILRSLRTYIDQLLL
jgi:hypothetical protein